MLHPLELRPQQTFAQACAMSRSGRPLTARGMPDLRAASSDSATCPRAHLPSARPRRRSSSPRDLLADGADADQQELRSEAPRSMMLGARPRRAHGGMAPPRTRGGRMRESSRAARRVGRQRVQRRACLLPLVDLQAILDRLLVGEVPIERAHAHPPAAAATRTVVYLARVRAPAEHTCRAAVWWMRLTDHTRSRIRYPRGKS